MMTSSQLRRHRQAHLRAEQASSLKLLHEIRPKSGQTHCLGQTVSNPQLLSPPLFVSWSQVADLRGIIGVHKDHEACFYTGEAHFGDLGIHCIFGAWFWGRQWTRFSHAS